MFNYQNCWVLVDVSFLLNYGAHATFVKYKDQYAEMCGEDFNPLEEIDTFESEMLAYFDQQLFNAISSISPIIKREKVIYCFDCPRHKIWRKEIFEGYKGNRDKVKRKFNMKPIHETVREWINKQCVDYKSQIAKADSAEGDDLLYHFTKRILTETSDSVINVSGDFDICTLLGDRVKQVHPDGTELSLELMYEKIEKKHKMTIEFDKTAENFLHFKILTGDTSDSIPSVRPRKMGPKTAPKYIADLSMLSKLLKSDNEVFEAYKRNTKLIKMKDVPVEVTNIINESTKDVVLFSESSGVVEQRPIEEKNNYEDLTKVVSDSCVEYKAEESVVQVEVKQKSDEELDLDKLLDDVCGQ